MPHGALDSMNLEGSYMNVAHGPSNTTPKTPDEEKLEHSMAIPDAYVLIPCYETPVDHKGMRKLTVEESC